VEDWAEIRRLHRAEGVPIKEIARRLGIARNTVRAALREELRAGHIKKRNRSHAVRARCTAWAASSCPLVINPEITPSTSAAG
jgi:IS30 family transposase